MSDKLIITNLSALRRKYAGGTKRIEAAIQRLVQADRARGVATTVASLEDPASMKPLGVAAVTGRSPSRYKQAVDALYRHLGPDYLMLLGAPDVVPHLQLANPTWDSAHPDQDPDRRVPSDLPYASDAPYSTDPGKFIAPTRVVGRLPDIQGAKGEASAEYLVRVLNTATRAAPVGRANYESVFGISAKVWQASTTESLAAVGAGPDDLNLSPKKGPKWTVAQLARRIHFINCHGAQTDPRYYGQEGGAFPPAHDAAYLSGQTLAGVVAAAECCYGAELYDPAQAGMMQAGIANTYLEHGGLGFFGSSTIAYGPSSGNDYADLICQFFLQQVLAGSSCGRAALIARQQYVRTAGILDPVDLKTIAQFFLLGDPSVQPVRSDLPQAVPGLQKGPRAVLAAIGVGRTERRLQLAREGYQLLATPKVSPRTADRVSPALRKRILDQAPRDGGVAKSVRTFRVAGPSAESLAFSKGLRAKAPAETRIHLVMGAKSSKGGIHQISVTTVREQDGQLTRTRKGVSR